MSEVIRETNVRTTQRPSSTNPGRPRDSAPYRSRRHLLTPGERRFFLNGLQPALGDRYRVSFKVRLADVIAASDWDSPHTRRIAQKHVDFVLTTPRTTRIVAIVELNDASHEADDRRKRDAFVAEALKSAGIPLVTLPIYRHYSPQRIRRRVLSAIRSAQRQSARMS